VFGLGYILFVCLDGLFIGLVGLLVGGARLFLFRETPAQFAVYKSPEQGLNGGLIV
jgi:hypothetical protein